MRVLVYSQFRLLGESLTRYLGECAHVARVKFCHRAERLVDGVIEIDADVVLFDMTNERAVDEARAVGAACPQVRLVALGIPEVSDKVIACADAGFTGYIPNRVSLDELVQAMDQALQGGLVCNPQIAGSLLREVWKRRSNKTDRGSVELLTARESDVLALVARGDLRVADQPTLERRGRRRCMPTCRIRMVWHRKRDGSIEWSFREGYHCLLLWPALILVLPSQIEAGKRLYLWSGPILLRHWWAECSGGHFENRRCESARARLLAVPAAWRIPYALPR